MKSSSKGSENSLLSHLKIVENKLGKTPKELIEYYQLPRPKELMYILDLFYDFYDGQDFSYTELKYFQDFRQVELDCVEVELIRQLFLEKKRFDNNRMQSELKNGRNSKSSR